MNPSVFPCWLVRSVWLDENQSGARFGFQIPGNLEISFETSNNFGCHGGWVGVSRVQSPPLWDGQKASQWFPISPRRASSPDSLTGSHVWMQPRRTFQLQRRFFSLSLSLLLLLHPLLLILHLLSQLPLSPQQFGSKTLTWEIQYGAMPREIQPIFCPVRLKCWHW